MAVIITLYFIYATTDYAAQDYPLKLCYNIPKFSDTNIWPNKLVLVKKNYYIVHLNEN